MRVNPDASGPEDGSSWQTAYRTLASALSHEPLDEPLEIWLKGDVIDGMLNLERAVSIYGGFQGTETRPWEREPDTVRSSLTASISTNGFPDCLDTNLVLDGIHLQGGELTAHTYYGSSVEFRSVHATDFSISATRCSTDVGSYQFTFDEVKFTGGRFLSTNSLEGQYVSLEVHRSEFTGGAEPTIDLAAAPGIGNRVELDVSSNRFDGGSPALRVRCGGLMWDGSYLFTGQISRNYVLHSGDAGVVISADCGTTTGKRVDVDLVVAQNTIVNGTGSGIHIDAVRGQPDRPVRVRPQIWDNIIAHNLGAAIEECDDGGTSYSTCDPIVAGNDLFANGAYYLDEGSIWLPNIASVNALSEAFGNFDEDPLFVSPASDDYHILATSPAIDRGHLQCPVTSSTDFDGDVGLLDGDGDGISRRDVGADEFHPSYLNRPEGSAPPRRPGQQQSR